MELICCAWRTKRRFIKISGVWEEKTTVNKFQDISLPVRSKNLICVKWRSLNGAEGNCWCAFIVNWFKIMTNNWEFLKNCYLLLVNGNQLLCNGLIKGWLNLSENNKFWNRIIIISSKLEFQFAWNKKKPVNKENEFCRDELN